MNIRPCQQQDVRSICDIYNHYVDNSIATFEEVHVTEQEMQRRISAGMESFPWLVCVVDDQVVGYAYASKWQGRSAYRYSAEVTVYVRHGEARRGYGRGLYAELLDRLAGTYHAIIAGISLPNESSARLHETFGFEKVAHLREVGRKFGRWIDVGYWQKLMPTTEEPA